MVTSIGVVFLIDNRLNGRGIDAARVVQRRARVVFPAAYLVVFLIEVADFLVAAGAGSSHLR